MLFIARKVSPLEFGELSILIALANIFSVIQDLGSSFIVVRETAAKKFDDKKIVGSTLFLKVFSGVLSFLGVVFLAKALGYSASVQKASYLFAGGLIGESFLLTIVKHFEGLEEMKASSLLMLTERIIIAILIILIFGTTNLITDYGYAYIISNLFVALIGLLLIFKNTLVFQIIDFNIAKKIFLLSFPFIIYNVFSILNYRSDIFLISSFLGNDFVGEYRAAFQIIESFYFISISLSVSLLPFFSRKNIESREKLLPNYSLTIKILFMFGIIISFVIFANSKQLLIILYGNKYLNASFIFQLLSITIPFYYLSTIVGNLLIAIEKEKFQILSMIISTVVKILLMVPLIKYYGIQGAAISAISGEILSFLIQYLSSIKHGFGIDILKSDIIKFLIIIIWGTIIIYIQSILISIILLLPLCYYLFYDLIVIIKKQLIN